ncbi:aldo/keto reductase [Sphingobium sp. Sx8-8]|uniref:aldo/keto reductase n=1 Tax=Sphingobium sp. Sx8-8 TaxID=2933617 RepID=UPI001F56D985|nr:aldo/keto reductase [Sphingobium sp. Sx8-8]
MEYAYLGYSGLAVSKLGFGAMTFATEGGMPFAGLSRSDAAIVIDKLLDAGVTLFDTANVYCSGESEGILGDLLGDRRADTVIVTKGGSRADRSPNDVGLSARHLHMSIEGSLKRLGTDWIDVYLCHLPDTRTPIEETLLALDQIVRSGKARYIGFSNWPAWLASKAVAIQKENGWARFVTGQYQYNLLDREIEHEIVPAAIDAGVGIMAYSPLASGVLSGKYSDNDPTGSGGRLSKIQLLNDVDHALARTVVSELLAIAQERNVPAAAVALAWAAQQPSVSTVLLGINRIDQADANLAAADLLLSAEEVKRLSVLSQPTPRYPAAMLKALGDGWGDPRDRDVAPRYADRGLWAADAAN